MKTNKFNSSNSLLAVAVILLVGGVGIGTYYGVNETIEMNYLKDKSNTILNALNNFSLSFMKKKSRGFLSKSPKNSNINSFNVTYNSGNYKLPFVHSFSCSHTLRKNSKVFLITNDK